MSALSRRGFTLIEMLVVLVLLAALSTVALRAVDGLQDRARYETTLRRLEEVELALFGTRDGLPGESRSGGLLADTGRLLEGGLIDLAERPRGVDLNSLHPAPGDPPVDSEIKLATGWRGPYLRRLTGLAQAGPVDDGWGRPIQVGLIGNAWHITSLGADGALGGESYDADVAIEIPVSSTEAHVAGSAVIPSDVLTGLGPNGENWTILVRGYGPDPVNGKVRPFDDDKIGVVPGEGDYQFELPTMTPGPRILRAYLLDDNEVLRYKSSAVLIQLGHGWRVIDLTIDRQVSAGENEGVSAPRR